MPAPEADQPNASEPATGTAAVASTAEEPVGGFRTRVKIKPKPAAGQPRDAPSTDGHTDGPGDRLDLIDGLGVVAAARLRQRGIASFAQIAHWTPVEVEFWRRHLGDCAHGPASGWIEQAAILCQNRMTHYAGRVLRGETTALAPFPDQHLETALPETVVPHRIVSEPAASPPPARPTTDVDNFFTSAPGAPIAVIPPGVDAPAMLPADNSGLPAQAPPRPSAREASVRQAQIRLAPVQIAPDHADGIRANGSLLTRLSSIRALEPPLANYAAYRGIAEEASVTIVRSKGLQPEERSGRDEPNPPQQNAMQPAAPSDTTAPPGSIGRLLKALTGKA